MHGRVPKPEKACACHDKGTLEAKQTREHLKQSRGNNNAPRKPL